MFNFLRFLYASALLFRTSLAVLSLLNLHRLLIALPCTFLILVMYQLWLLMLLASCLGVVAADYKRSEPAFNITSRRRTFNCNQDKRLKNIEAKAWADAGALASVAAEYDKWNKWQPAMDYGMGIDSIESENLVKIKCKYLCIYLLYHEATCAQLLVAALQNEKNIHSPNWFWPEAVVDIYCGDTYPGRVGKTCQYQENPTDPDGPWVTQFASSWIERGLFYNTYTTVLCNRFFEEKESLDTILYQMKYGNKNPSNASEYKLAWGHTIYHELMHMDPISNNTSRQSYNVLILNATR